MDVAVAVGTLALALVGAIALVVNLQVTREAYRSRIDSSSLRVVVTSSGIARTLAASSIGEPQPADAGITWDMTQHGHVQLSLELYAQFHNEGQVTAFVRVLGNETIQEPRVRLQTEPLGITPQQRFKVSHPPKQGDWFLVQPREQVAISWRWTLPASEWMEAYENMPQRLAAGMATIEARDGTGNAWDRCTAAFGAALVIPKPASDGWTIGAQHLEPQPGNPTPMGFVAISLMNRTYPHEPKGLGHLLFWRR